MRGAVTAGIVLLALMVAAACTSASTTTQSQSPSPSGTKTPAGLAAFANALPPTATVLGSRDHGKWGNVVVVSDSPDNMAAGPTTGDTFSALGMWLSDPQIRQGFIDAGWTYVLACSSSVNVSASGVASIVGSEMIPLKANAGVVTVKTGQPTDSANNTTIDCPT